MITVTHYPTAEEKLFSNLLAASSGLASLGLSMSASPLATIAAKTFFDMGVRFAGESLLPQKKAGMNHLVKISLSSATKNIICTVTGKYQYLFGGVAECAEALVMGEKPTFKTFMVGTAAGAATAGTTHLIDDIIRYNYKDWQLNLIDYKSTGNLIGLVVYRAPVGAISAATGQLTRNILNEKPLHDGLLEAALMGGVTTAAMSALIHFKSSTELNNLKTKDLTRYNFVKDFYGNLIFSLTNYERDHSVSTKVERTEEKKADSDTSTELRNRIEVLENSAANYKAAVEKATEATKKAVKALEDFKGDRPALRKALFSNRAKKAAEAAKSMLASQ